MNTRPGDPPLSSTPGDPAAAGSAGAAGAATPAEWRPAPRIVDDVTRLNPIRVRDVVVPTSVSEVCEILRGSEGPVSIGGGRFSMGGQTASPDSLHIDMRKLNAVLSFLPAERLIRVQAGIRWCDVQAFLDPHGLSVSIMQTYANFTVGGSLSVNCHGRYVGQGPLILSVRSIAIVLADGSLVHASPQDNSEIFYGAVGGYGGLGVIVEAELVLAENDRVERVAVKMPLSRYVAHFRETVRGAPDAVFHNADLYPPHYVRARSVTWKKTDKPVTVPQRRMPLRKSHTIERYAMWAISETPLGKWRREFVFDPLVYLRPRVHWRNYEAGYDVAELEPPSRTRRTYVLQEYFVPVERFEEFVPKMAEILGRHRVNMLNVSVRHAHADPGSLLAWARTEVFAFVLYYKQRVRENAKDRVAVWTRELIDAAIAAGGSYYLPYQAHATGEQFHRAYPRARELFLRKSRLDPEFRFRNVIWDTYYAPMVEPPASKPPSRSEFHAVYDDPVRADAFYRFLQNVYRIYPEDRFHTLIKQACARHVDSNGADGADEAIYRDIQSHLGEIKPFLSELFYALPALRKQKLEMAGQALEALGGRTSVDGYVEIGSIGRYASELRRRVRFTGPVYVVHESAPTNSPLDILERGGFAKVGQYFPLDDYAPLPPAIADASIDVLTCFIGLHHCPPARLDAFVRSIARVVRPGGLFLLRDHDVPTPQMKAFVSLVHAVFNAGLRLPWEANRKELRHFAPVAHWTSYVQSRGFQDTGLRRLQPHDPSDNTLLAFVRESRG